MIDDAIFTSPPRYEHSGSGLLDENGKLVGIASLWVSDTLEIGAAFPGNMFVPIDLLKPMLDDLVVDREAPGSRTAVARRLFGAARRPSFRVAHASGFARPSAQD